MADATSYLDVLDAVKEYYGAGSDQWVEIAKYGLSSSEAYNILKQVPNVNIITNGDGSVRAYTYNKTVKSANTIVESIDSNVSVNSYKSQIPAIMSESVETGKLSSISGIGLKAGTTTVSGVLSTINVATAAVSVGCKLGVLVDDLLYNAAPDFWDEHGMGSLNPDTWEAFSEDTLGGRVLNTLLGLDPDTNEVTQYMDATAVAYMALYMKNNGVFDSTVKIVDIPEGFNKSVLQYLPIVVSTLPLYYTYTVSGNVHSAQIPLKSDYAGGSSGIILGRDIGYRDLFKYVEYATTDLDGQLTNSFIYAGKRVYYRRASKLGNYTLSSVTGDYNKYDSVSDLDVVYGYGSYLAWLGAYNSSIVGVSGITRQSGAKIPDLSKATTVDETLETLKEQYPELWENAITNTVLQPDGTYKEYTYIPVGTAVNTGNATQPVSGSTTQANSAINPETATETELNQMAQELGKTLTPDNINTDSETGTGGSPAVIVPLGSASALYKIYNPTQDEINSFGAWLWSSNFVDQLLKLFNDPMQAIIGLHKVFCNVPVGGRENIKVGYLDSGVSSNYVSGQYVTIDCGSVSVSEFFGNVLDYAPYTQVYIYLPFIGIQNLKTSDVMRSTVNVVYHCDVLTGACLAEVHCIRDGSDAILYTYCGNCAVQYPVSSGSYMGIVSSIASVVGGAIGTIASGGSMLPLAISGVNAALSAHTDVSHSGGFSGNSGAMGVKTPYIIINRIQSAIPNDLQSIGGLTSNYSVTLNNCSGVVRVSEVTLEGISATEQEKDLIESLLKEGVII